MAATWDGAVPATTGGRQTTLTSSSLGETPMWTDPSGTGFGYPDEIGLGMPASAGGVFFASNFDTTLNGG